MNPEAQKYLDQLAAGKIDLDDPALLKAAAQLPELQRELDELQLVQGWIDGPAYEEASIIASAQAAQPQPGDRERVVGASEGLAGPGSEPGRVSTPPAARSGWRAGGWVAACAAAVLAVWLLWPSSGPPSDQPYDPGPALGGGPSVELLSPQGPVATLGQFTWRGAEESPAWYIVHVQDLDRELSWKSMEIRETTWSLDFPESTERIEWWVQCFRGSSNQSSESPRWRASRSR